MDDITKYMELLIRAIKESSEYRLYKQAEADLNEDPKLKLRVDDLNRASAPYTERSPEIIPRDPWTE